MNVFLKTFVITLVVFSLGVAAGLWLDITRSDEADRKLAETALELTDILLLDSLYKTQSNASAFCDAAIKSNMDFNSRIYEEGKNLDRLEAVNKLGPDTILKKKRYAMLQMQFWLNAVQIRNKCGANYDTVVYFYNNEETPDQKADQRVQSDVLQDLKEKCGGNIMLIPIPLDMNITSVDTVKYQYKIESAPAVLINEKTPMHGVQGIKNLENQVNC